MGCPRKEITVRGTLRETADGGVLVDTEAEQDGNRIVRNAVAGLAG